MLGLVEPHMTGMGGDLFALVWSAADSRLYGLNASGRSGSGMTREVLLERGRERVPGRGAEAITVPGALSGWAALLDRFGSLSLKDALAPSIALAENGFPVSPIIAGDWLGAEDIWMDGQSEGARKARDSFVNTYLPDGRSPRAGQWFQNPELASTYRSISEEGIDVFYGGAIGQRGGGLGE